MSLEPSRITVPQFVALKAQGRKIGMLTAYDYTMAGLVDAAGVDGILVGDSMAMAVQGRSTTLPVTLDEIIYHAEMVGRAVKRALVVADLPFPCGRLGDIHAVEAASRILKRTQCQAVKLEGGADQASVIAAMVAAGIPVMAHCGLRPQAVNVLGGYKVQRNEKQSMNDALAAQEAGAFAVVLECIPAEVATKITATLHIPTIGIGAGAGCDGQVLVINDLLGLTSGYVPKFAKAYADLKQTISRAVAQYVQEVREGKFPDAGRAYK